MLIGRAAILPLLACCLALFMGCKNAQFHAEEGIQHLDQGRDVTALTSFERALDKDAENPLALYGKGRILLARQVTRDIGKKMLTSALPRLTMVERQQRACLLLADAHYRDKLAKKASTTLEDCLKNGIHSVAIYNNLAQYKIEQRDVDSANAHLKMATQKYPNEADAHYNLGVLQATKLRKYKDAKASFEKANGLQPNRPDALFNLMKVLYLLKERDGALKILDQLSKLPGADAARFADLRKRIERGRWDAKNDALAPRR